MIDRLKFLKTALLNHEIGALARSSRFVIEDVLEQIGQRRLNKVIEYGPGDGVMTRALLHRLEPDGRLLAVDANPDFLVMLQDIRDPRFHLMAGMMEDVSKNLSRYGFAEPDLVVSSIPFSRLSEGEREVVVQATYDALPTGGQLIIFHQYSRLMREPLQKVFGTVKVRLEPRNFLPCWIFSVIKA